MLPRIFRLGPSLSLCLLFPQSFWQWINSFPTVYCKSSFIHSFFWCCQGFHISKSKSHNFYLHVCWQCETYANIKKWWKRLKWYFAAFRFGWFYDECVFNKKQERKWVFRSQIRNCRSHLCDNKNYETRKSKILMKTIYED